MTLSLFLSKTILIYFSQWFEYSYLKKKKRKSIIFLSSRTDSIDTPTQHYPITAEKFLTSINRWGKNWGYFNCRAISFFVKKNRPPTFAIFFFFFLFSFAWKSLWFVSCVFRNIFAVNSMKGNNNFWSGIKK